VHPEYSVCGASLVTTEIDTMPVNKCTEEMMGSMMGATINKCNY